MFTALHGFIFLSGVALWFMRPRNFSERMAAIYWALMTLNIILFVIAALRGL